MPIEHGVQLVAPAMAVNVPTEQGMHGALPVLLNVPGAHAWPRAVAAPESIARPRAIEQE